MSCEIRSMMTAYFFGSSMRMPPILTNSAVTPSAFMPLIFSTSAGGNVFSIPKRIPIFLVVTEAPYDLNRRSLFVVRYSLLHQQQTATDELRSRTTND